MNDFILARTQAYTECDEYFFPTHSFLFFFPSYTYNNIWDSVAFYKSSAFLFRTIYFFRETDARIIRAAHFILVRSSPFPQEAVEYVLLHHPINQVNQCREQNILQSVLFFSFSLHHSCVCVCVCKCGYLRIQIRFLFFFVLSFSSTITLAFSILLQLLLLSL